MSVQHDETQTNRDIKITNDDGKSTMPKRGAAHVLWKMSLDEWRQFQAGEVSAAALKQRYSGSETEQAALDDFGGDDQ